MCSSTQHRRVVMSIRGIADKRYTRPHGNQRFDQTRLRN
jgi:hypothetical protein